MSRDYATVQRGGGGLGQRKLGAWDGIAAYAVVGLIHFLALAPQVGLRLLPLVFRTLKRIIVLLMMGGMLAGIATSYAPSAVESSATLMRGHDMADAPLAYWLYVFMLVAAGRGRGDALGSWSSSSQ